MKTTEKQLQLLMSILQDTIKMDLMGIYTIPFKDRVKLFGQIINQQSEELIDIEGIETDGSM